MMVSQLVWFIVIIVSIIIAFFIARILMKVMNKKSMKKLQEENEDNPDFLLDPESKYEDKIKKEVQENATWKETKDEDQRIQELERRLEDERERLRDIRERGKGLEVPRPDREGYVRAGLRENESGIGSDEDGSNNRGEQLIETTDKPDKSEGQRNLPTESSDNDEGHKRKFKWD